MKFYYQLYGLPYVSWLEFIIVNTNIIILKNKIGYQNHGCMRNLGKICAMCIICFRLWIYEFSNQKPCYVTHP
jgi:hypothetical protein